MGDYRNSAKGGKTNLGGNIKCGGSLFHGKGMANGGRVGRMRFDDGGEAAASAAWKNREDWENRQRDARVDEPAEAPMTPVAQTTPSASASYEAAHAPAPAMDARQSEPAEAPMKAAALGDDTSGAPPTISAKEALEIAGSAISKGSKRLGKKPPKSYDASAEAKTKTGAKPYDASAEAKGKAKPASDEGETGWDKTQLGQAWSGLKKGLSSISLRTPEEEAFYQKRKAGGRADGGAVEKEATIEKPVPARERKYAEAGKDALPYPEKGPKQVITRADGGKVTKVKHSFPAKLCGK